MTSPWAKITKPDVNFEEIMSEEVARELHSKELRKQQNNTQETNTAFFSRDDYCDEIPVELLRESELTSVNPAEFAVTDDGIDSDAQIAKMLQSQYDKEYNEILQRTEDKINGKNKVSISFSNYKRPPINQEYESDSEEEELVDICDRKDWDRFDSVQREFKGIPPCGYHVKKDGSIITKHDMMMSARRNVCKMMSFPPEFETGDGAGFDMKLSNKVFNDLKMHWKHEEARRYRMHDREDRATAEFGLDEFTTLLIYKMINSQLLERVNGVISIGKEAVVLHAETDPNSPDGPFPKECALKVFKTTLSEFKQRDKYIKDDHRFKDRVGKQSSRKIVHLWAEKEMQNLKRAARANIPCPEVVTLKKHVLVMSFIGKDNRPAPKLKDAKLSMDEYILAYDQVVEIMKTFYTKANLIHADLSEYNILWFDEKCYLIDISQSVEPMHENAFFFLMRDCGNITNFFEKKHVPGIFTAEQLFHEIVGCDYADKIALEEVRESIKMKPHLVDRPGFESSYSFENCWQKSTTNENKNMESSPMVDPIVS